MLTKRQLSAKLNLNFIIANDAINQSPVNEAVVLDLKDDCVELHFPNNPGCSDDVRVVIEVFNGELRAIVYDDPNDEEPTIIPIKRKS